MSTVSRYGGDFDEWAAEWARLENDHDRMHPDRDQCGGVGSCPMMREAVDIEQRLIGQLGSWRKQEPAYQHRAFCRGAIGELLCDGKD